MKLFQAAAAVLTPLLAVNGQNVVLTNDDGWAVAMIREQFALLNRAGYNVCVYSLTPE
jgi:5'-nucleotidase